MTVQPSVCRTWLEPKLLVFLSKGLYYYLPSIAIVTRAKSGLEKPKQFDQSFVTPVKRKAATIVHATSDPKKVKVEIITDSSGETYHVSENADCGDGGEKGNFEEALEIASNSEKDLSAVAQSGTKLTVHFENTHTIRVRRLPWPSG